MLSPTGDEGTIASSLREFESVAPENDFIRVNPKRFQLQCWATGTWTEFCNFAHQPISRISVSSRGVKLYVAPGGFNSEYTGYPPPLEFNFLQAATILPFVGLMDLHGEMPSQ